MTEEANDYQHDSDNDFEKPKDGITLPYNHDNPYRVYVLLQSFQSWREENVLASKIRRDGSKILVTAEGVSRDWLLPINYITSSIHWSTLSYILMPLFSWWKEFTRCFCRSTGLRRWLLKSVRNGWWIARVCLDSLSLCLSN